VDKLLKLFENVSLGEILIAWLVFLAGLGIGLLVAWPLRRKRDKELRDFVGSLHAAIRNIDAEVDKLWEITFRSSHRRVPAQVQNALPPDKESLILYLFHAPKELQSLRENLNSIIRNWPQPPGRGAESPRHVSIDPVTPPIIVRRSSMNHTSRFPVLQSPEPNLDIETHLTVAQNTPNVMVEFYNRAVNDPVAGERFREDYSPIRIGTVNAVERRQNPTIKAEIRETSDGDFFALPIEGTKNFAVFPRLGLTIEAVSYTAGAMGEVFEKTRNHDPKLFYSRYRVKQPAIFRSEGGRWQLCEPGELELGLGE
jgi:hypothetical protein